MDGGCLRKEWEYAARAGTDSEYAWSEDLDEVVGTMKTAKVKRTPWERKANGWGLYDEWECLGMVLEQPRYLFFFKAS